MLSSAVVPALPTIQHDLHTSETGVTWLLTAYLLSASVGTSILGPARRHVRQGASAAVDARDPRRRHAARGRSRARSALLIVARVIQGVGGGIFPLAFGIVRDEFPRERVAGSIGLMSSILGVGGGIGIVRRRA